MEVMGLMLGEFVDDYTVRVIDVFAMPQSGTGVSVEAVDPVFQTKMLDMLKQTGRFANFFFFFDQTRLYSDTKFPKGLKLLLVGITVILGLVVGYQVLILIHNKYFFESIC